MRRIISCSRRTDLAAFYTPWLLGRLRAGSCEVANPFSGRLYQVSLRPEDCIALVFWTRNPAPLLPHLDELDARGYRYYFHVSLLGYPRWLESHSPDLTAGLRTFRRLAARVSPERVRWRYDPIVISDATPPEYHLEQFARIARALEGATGQCTFSFVSLYGKTVRNLARVSASSGVSFRELGPAEQLALVRELAAIGARHGIALATCCQDHLAVDGVRRGRCIDPELVQALQPDLAEPLKAQPTRAQCGCVASTDIGAYDTCLFGCAYCYATSSRAAARRRHAAHRPDDSLLWRPERLAGLELAPG
jgi:hypothetical protein